jgi:hypothetical protein
VVGVWQFRKENHIKSNENVKISSLTGKTKHHIVIDLHAVLILHAVEILTFICFTIKKGGETKISRRKLRGNSKRFKEFKICIFMVTSDVRKM